jgi:hypothetical protein
VAAWAVPGRLPRHQRDLFMTALPARTGGTRLEWGITNDRLHLGGASRALEGGHEQAIRRSFTA